MRHWFVIALLGIGLWAGLAGAARADRLRVDGVRIDASDGLTRVSLELSRPGQFRLSTLTNPHRVVLDMSSAALGPSALPLPRGGGAIRQIVVAHRPGGNLRMVFEVDRAMSPLGALLTTGRSLRLEFRPVASYAIRPAPSVQPEKPAVSTASAEPVTFGSESTKSGAEPSVARPPAQLTQPLPQRPLVVAVDAGHGGHDPGAIGPSGLREKHVTLAISRRLVALLNNEPGMAGVLTRSSDQFVDLRGRMEKARGASADLFVSVHADAAHNRRARGSTVYVLSNKGASDEAARRLAARENAALIGGVELGDKDPVLASVLMDLSQNAALSSSITAGDAILRQLAGLGTLHRRTVQQAPFMVLKSPDVPSVLVETAYISNPTDERRLRSPEHQERIARAILGGIRQYFRANPPPRTIMASTRAAPSIQHVIRRGDTLTSLAGRYNVSVRRIRVANSLNNDQIRVGQRLVIPREDT